MRLSACFFAGVLAIAACSSGSGGSGGEPGSIAGLCTSYCDWQTRCGKAKGGCVDDCKNESAEYDGKWSATYSRAVSSCFSGLACDRSDDACVGDFKAADPAYPEIPEVKDCIAKREECFAAGTAYPDDLCHSIAALVEGSRRDADHCRGRSCGEVSDCLRAAGAFSF